MDATPLSITVGAEHERVGGSFYQEIVQKITSIPGPTHRSIEPFCSTRVQVPGVRGKEGDESLGPVTRVGRDAWPSLVIEVGFSQGWNQLRRDAVWWLTNSGSRTRFIIIIKIGRSPFQEENGMLDDGSALPYNQEFTPPDPQICPGF